MSKLKEHAPTIFITVLIMGALLGGYAYYVHAKVLPAQRAQLDNLRLAHAADLERSAAETRQEIAAISQLLKDSLSARSNGLFQTEEEVAAVETAQVTRLAAAVAQQLQAYNPSPQTPEEAEALRNAQVDQVSSRLAERIQPILGQIATDQNLTRESLDRYATQISQEVSGVLGGELARNERLGTQVQLTQSLAQESVALSSELTALYLSSVKDQGVINRLLLLPANIVRDASNLSLLNNQERREKETELTKRLRDIQTRLDAARTATDGTVADSSGPGDVIVEPAPSRVAPSRPAAK